MRSAGLRITGIAVCAVLVVLFFGCLATTPPAVQEPIYETIDVEKPMVTLAPGYEYIKTMEGVTIEVNPVEFEENEGIHRSIEEKSSLLVMNEMYTYKVTDVPVIRYQPDRVLFKLKITNNLSHVLRMKDCVVSFTVNGKPYSGLDAEELRSQVLIPQQSWEGEIYGPTRDELEPSSNLVFAVFDVVTEVDAANNPTKRTNFEWIFTYDVEAGQRQVEVKHYEKKMTRDQARAFMGG